MKSVAGNCGPTDNYHPTPNSAAALRFSMHVCVGGLSLFFLFSLTCSGGLHLLAEGGAPDLQLRARNHQSGEASGGWTAGLRASQVGILCWMMLL